MENQVEGTSGWADIILLNDDSLESYHRKIETELVLI